MSGESGVLIVERTGVVLARSVTIARHPLDQFRGWIGRADIAGDAALAIPHCPCVHTIGMRFPLDVVYCLRGGQVLRVVAGLPPLRCGPGAWGAFWTWEMRAGGLAPFVVEGDRLIVSPEPV